jgi:sec-independent protein translocase protein TatA
MFEGLLQPAHLLVIIVILLIVFGPQKLPQLGRGLGESIRGFRDALKATGDSIEGGASHQEPGSHQEPASLPEPRSDQEPTSQAHEESSRLN